MATSSSPKAYLGLDMGEQRIGVAFADGIVPIAVPLLTINVDGTERDQLQKIMQEKAITDVIVGLPRNQSGDITAQTMRVQQMVYSLLDIYALPIHYQDESVTSIQAEERLKSRGKAYQKGDIDREAATIILQDYLDSGV